MVWCGRRGMAWHGSATANTVAGLTVVRFCFFSRLMCVCLSCRRAVVCLMLGVVSRYFCAPLVSSVSPFIRPLVCVQASRRLVAYMHPYSSVFARPPLSFRVVFAASTRTAPLDPAASARAGALRGPGDGAEHHLLQDEAGG